MFHRGRLEFEPEAQGAGQARSAWEALWWSPTAAGKSGGAAMISDDDPYGLGRYAERFRTIVLRRLQSMPDTEWQELREWAADGRGVDDDDVPSEPVTRESLVRETLFEDGLELSDLLKSGFGDRATEIGSIEGYPVLYIEGTGIFAWGSDKTIGTLAVWITYPAYPPGW